MYLFSGSAAGPLLTLSTTHRGAEAPRIHDANVRSTAHDDDGSHTAEARKRGAACVLTRGHERVAPGPPGRADGASGTAVTSGVMPLSACDRPVARPVARIARATRTPQSHATFT